MRASSAASLRKRVERYLDLGVMPDRRRLKFDVLPAFKALGPTAIVGGMLRDLAREGPSGYSSDIDLVVDPYDHATFREVVRGMGGKENRFGGFGLEWANWKVDVWALPDTWARTSGLRTVEVFADLVACTFFDWDAVVYDLRRREVMVGADYFSRLASGVLGLNLRDNPNEAGSAVRALRRAALWRVSLSAALAEYVLEAERRFGWDSLRHLDSQAFATPVLAHLDWDGVAATLAAPNRMDGGWATGLIADRIQANLWAQPRSFQQTGSVETSPPA